MSNEKSKDWVKGYVIGKKIGSSPYPVRIDDFDGDRDEFLRGLRFAGYYGEVQFDG